jgi:hypothetical protein
MPNDLTLPDGTARIPLRARDGSVRAYAVVDAADVAFANQWTWRLDGDGYAKRGERTGAVYEHIFLHRELLGLPRVHDGREGDHIDRDRLNDRRGNLRVVARAVQVQNQSGHRGASSRHRGVTWDKSRSKWQANVKSDGRLIHLGRFVTEEEAAQAAQVARRRLLPFAVD